MSVQNEITEYATYFKRQIEDVKRLKLEIPTDPEQPWELRLYCKLLYVCLIDSLSKGAFPSIGNHHDRVMRLIDEMSDWSDKDRVNIPHLLSGLDKKGLTSGPLYRKMKGHIEPQYVDGVRRPCHDPLLSEIQATGDELQAVQKARYAELFYAARNYLVHEFRNPPRSHEFDAGATTPYQFSTARDGEKIPWEPLVFPPPFLEGLCTGCLNGLIKRLQAEQRNPFDSYGRF